MSNLVKEVHKSSGITDWNNTLNSLWRSDEARPWDTVYSKEKFTKFWDGRNSVTVTVKDYSR